MHRSGLPALALAATLCASSAAAQSTYEAPAGSGRRYPEFMLVDPITGQPYSATGGTGGGGGTVGSTNVTPTPTQIGPSPSQPVAQANDGHKYLELYNEGTVSCRYSYDNVPSLSTTSPTGVPLPPGDFVMESKAITAQSVWVACPQTTQIDVILGQ